MNRSGLTLIEVMIAVALASFIAGIGFTGIVAFGRSITRAKQFVSETELITATMRIAVQRADSAQDLTPDIGLLPTPKNWTKCEIIAGDQIQFTMQLTTSGNSTAATTGDVRKALQMDSGVNTLTVKALPCR